MYYVITLFPPTTLRKDQCVDFDVPGGISDSQGHLRGIEIRVQSMTCLVLLSKSIRAVNVWEEEMDSIESGCEKKESSQHSQSRIRIRS